MTATLNVSSLIADWGNGGICLRPLAKKYGISPATAKTYLNNAGVNTSKKQCFTKKVWTLIEDINAILKQYDGRLTVRQVYYQLASKHIVPLSKDGYLDVQSACSKGRKYGYIDWNSIEDRTRQPHTPVMWDNLLDYSRTIKSVYRKDIWYNQPTYFEVWLEKNALYGVISPITQRYGVTLQVLTGYSSITAIYDGVERFKQRRHILTNGNIPVNDDIEKHITKSVILYLGDHDATGIDIDRSIRHSLVKDHKADFIEVHRIGLLYEDIEKYDLLPNPIKESDSRAKNYLYKKQAELDALPPNILINIVESAIKKQLDMTAYQECQNTQTAEMNRLLTSLSGVQFGGES